MKKKDDQIDRLLERNASEQLAGVDWDKLNTDISQGLDWTRCGKVSTIWYPSVFKLAAGFIVVAAVVSIAIMVRTDKPNTVQLEDSRRTVVKLEESKGSADVEILDSNGQGDQSADRSSWIIIRTYEPKVADNGQSRDEADFACLM
ncbi:MAG: hypothetical protein PVH77_06165 [Phycisphaerales bacterium]|jgi:hypothetical protein